MSDDLDKTVVRNRLAPEAEQSPAWYDISSAALQKRGPWLREYMPSTLADILAQALTYAPMAVPGMRGRVMENGLRPQDFAISNRTPDSPLAAPMMPAEINPSIQSAAKPTLHSAQARQQISGMTKGIQGIRDTIDQPTYNTPVSMDTIAMIQKRLNELQAGVKNQEAWATFNMNSMPGNAANRNLPPTSERSRLSIVRNPLDGE